MHATRDTREMVEGLARRNVSCLRGKEVHYEKRLKSLRHIRGRLIRAEEAIKSQAHDSDLYDGVNRAMR